MTKPTLNVVASTEVKIEKGIPLKKYGGSIFRKYPFNEMDPGDSFALGDGMDVTKVRYAAAAYGDRYQRKYAVRKTENGYRCWRVS